MSEYSLREAEENELDGLILEAEKYLPHSLTVHGLLSVGCKRKIVDKNHTKIYIPVKKDMPFFIIIIGIVMQKRNNLTPFWDPNEISREEAKMLLKSLPNWNWTEPTLFYASSLITLNEIEHILLGKEGLGNNKLTLLRRDGYAYRLADNTKLRHLMKTDTQFYVAPIDESFTPFVYKNWIYKYSNSYEGVYFQMKHLPGMAAFISTGQQNDSEDHETHNSTIIENQFENKKSPIIQNNSLNQNNERDEPVSFVATRYNGEIGFTYTNPKYQNKGLATAVTAALAQKLLEIDITPFVTINDPNPAAVRAHEKIGFQKCCTNGYHVYATEGMGWDE